MEHIISPIGSKKRIALIAHDSKKPHMLEWAKFNRDILAQHTVIATGTTGKLIAEELDIEVLRLQSGPLGGDLQMGAKIAEGEIDFVVFFWDPLASQPHDPDVKALLRVVAVWNIPIACNRASADFMFSSPLMNAEYPRLLPDYDGYTDQVTPAVESGNDQDPAHDPSGSGMVEAEP